MTPPNSGPATLHAAKTPPKMPWYFPRSARRNEIADGGLRKRHQPARAQSLQRAEKDELKHRLAKVRRAQSPRERCR